MAKPQFIRHNPQTLEWEHWVSTRADMSSSVEDIDDTTKGFWAPSLYGQPYSTFGYIIPTQSYVDVISTTTAKIDLYETINSGNVITPMKNTINNYNAIQQVHNLSITELIDPSATESLNPQDITPFKPYITYFNLDEIDVIKIAKNSILYAESNAVNPLNDGDMKFKWILGKDEIQSDLNSNIPNNKLIYTINIEKPSTFKLQVSNKAGVTESQEIEILPYDLKNNAKFGKNLITNTDGKSGLSGWITVEGTPRMNHTWDSITQQGRGDGWTTYVGHSNTDEVLKADFNIIGPHYDELFYPDWTPETFFEGGIDDNTPYSTLYYDIDLNDVIDIVDRKVLNVNDVTAKLFAYLGGEGGVIFFQSEWSWQHRQFQPYNQDRVELRVHLLDENDNIINQENYIYNPFNDRRGTSLFLRNVDFYIPIGTRKIRIWMKFTRCHNYQKYLVSNINIQDIWPPLVQPHDESNSPFELYMYNTYDYNRYIWCPYNKVPFGRGNMVGADYIGLLNQGYIAPYPAIVTEISESIYVSQSWYENIRNLQLANSSSGYIHQLIQSGSSVGLYYYQLNNNVLTYQANGSNYWDYLFNTRLNANGIVVQNSIYETKLSDYLWVSFVPTELRGYTPENGKWVHKHLSIATGINFILSVDNYTVFENENFYKIPSYQLQINKLDVGPLEPWNGDYVNRIKVPEYNLVYSSLFDKIADLKKQGITDLNTQYNKIIQSSFFTTKYTIDEIRAAVNNQSLDSFYNIRKNNKRFYI